MSHLCLFSFEIVHILQVGFVRLGAGEGVMVGEGWVLVLGYFFVSRIVYTELVPKTSSMKQCRYKRTSQKCQII